jgi:hypothetical protein
LARVFLQAKVAKTVWTPTGASVSVAVQCGAPAAAVAMESAASTSTPVTGAYVTPPPATTVCADTAVHHAAGVQWWCRRVFAVVAAGSVESAPLWLRGAHVSVVSLPLAGLAIHHDVCRSDEQPLPRLLLLLLSACPGFGICAGRVAGHGSSSSRSNRRRRRGWWLGVEERRGVASAERLCD